MNEFYFLYSESTSSKNVWEEASRQDERALQEHFLEGGNLPHWHHQTAFKAACFLEIFESRILKGAIR